jgi:alpha-beta hydrolase superfamily lysophospholipase
MIRARGEIIRFATRDGLLLDGFLMPSRKHDACVIHVHGMTGNFYGGDLQFAMASRLNKKGFALFTMNTRGHDVMSSAYRTLSELKKGRARHLTLGTSFEKFEDCVFDIGGAIRELQKIGYKRFVLSGHSTGCQKITYYQYKKSCSDVKGLILLAPTGDYDARKKELGHRFDGIVNKCRRLVRQGRGKSFGIIPSSIFSAKRFLSVADLKNVEARLFNYNGPLKEIGAIKPPVLAIFGSRDQYVTESVRKYMETLKRKRGSNPFSYTIIRGAKHSFGKHEDDVAKITTRWITERLGKA